MKIYEYTSSADASILKVKVIEAEEKEKTYKINRGQCWRRSVKKDDIGKFLDKYALIMYLIERDDARYVKALIEYQQGQVERAREKLEREEIKLERYKKRINEVLK